jgi:hypothetical protein
MSDTKSKVRILFKSGTSIDLEVEEFEMKFNGEQVTSLKWKGTIPSLMFIALTEIAAVFELEK